MSGELEAAGAMATAGLAAGAIEGREAGESDEGACLNCGAQLSGRYCAQCGQAAHPHRTLAHVFEEFLHGVLHFDTKAWRTLPMVIFRPGKLTREYVHGKRARYISPLALFLFTIFFMFFVFAFAMPEAPVTVAAPEEQRASAVRQLEDARSALAEMEADLAAELAAPADPSERAPGLEFGLARQAVELARAEVARREAALERIDGLIAAEAARTAPPPAAGVAEPEAQAESQAAGQALERRQRRSTTWQDVMRAAAENDDFVVIAGMPELNERIRYKFKNPDLALYKVQQTAYKFSFLLAPLSLPFIALLFLWRRGVTLYDHMVYALYALAFASLLFVVLVLTSPYQWLNWTAGWLLLVGLPVHTFFHLKGAYGLGWWSALWRTALMLVFALIILALFLIGIFIIGLW